MLHRNRNTTPHNQRAQARSRPLLVTDDDQILDAVLRLAAAASVAVDVAADPGSVRPRWAAPSLILVGADQTEPAAAAALSRRPEVLVVGLDPGEANLWRHAVAIGAEKVVVLPADESWLVDALADVAEGGVGATTIGVMGGRGGSGASVLAAGLAMTSTVRNRSTLLVDGDPYGGGLDLLLGAEQLAGLRWLDLANTRGRLAGTTLRDHLPEPFGLSLLSWDRGNVLAVPDDAVTAVVGAATRGWDMAVFDLPRAASAMAEIVLPRCDTLVLVVPAEVRAVAAAARVLAGSGSVASDVRVVVRTPAPSGLRAAEVADSLGLPLAGVVDTDQGLVRSIERGEPPGRSGRGPFAESCAEILERLGSRSRRRPAA